MIEAADRQYRPDDAIPPGETVRESLEALGMTQAELSRRSGLSAKHVNQILQGLAPVTPETALAFERVLGVPARFWNSLEANYRARRVRLREGEVSAEDAEWIRRLPVKELADRGFIESSTDAGTRRERLLTFFGVASRESWDAVWLAPDASFRRSTVFAADPHATAAWLRIGELEARSADVAVFNRARFFVALEMIRSLMREPPGQFEPEMRRLCAESGVVLVITDGLAKTRANGVARWLSPTVALVQLSLRGRWEDVFWFSFFHEAGHIALHGKRETFLEGDRRRGAEEQEADEFASNMLIPKRYEADLYRIRTLGEAQAFARRLAIPPAIVVGRLQHEGLLAQRVGNRLRRRFALVAEPGS